jgi:hypothetical protein
MFSKPKSEATLYHRGEEVVSDAQSNKSTKSEPRASTIADFPKRYSEPQIKTDKQKEDEVNQHQKLRASYHA